MNLNQYPDRQEAINRIADLLDDGEFLEGVIPAGQDEHVFYYLAIVNREYEGNTYMNERYVSLQKDDDTDHDDTFRKNGINRRQPDGQSLSPGLAIAYRAIYRRNDTGSEKNATLYVDPEGAEI